MVSQSALRTRKRKYVLAEKKKYFVTFVDLKKRSNKISLYTRAPISELPSYICTMKFELVHMFIASPHAEKISSDG